MTLLKNYENKNPEYDNKHIISVNLSEKNLKFLRYLKKELYFKSISDGVRQLIGFALPYFLNVNNTINKNLENKIKNIPYRIPKKINSKDLTLAELLKKYPDLKHINEV